MTSLSFGSDVTRIVMYCPSRSGPSPNDVLPRRWCTGDATHTEVNIAWLPWKDINSFKPTWPLTRRLLVAG